MGFYFRQSVKAGPFRFNFSKSGMGLSVGVRGLRIGTGPRGHYVQAGVDGFYYRTTIPRRSHVSPNWEPTTPHDSGSEIIPSQDGIRFIKIESGDVSHMVDSMADAIVKDISEKTAKARKSIVLAVCAAIGVGMLYVLNPNAGMMVSPTVLLGFALGAWIDSFTRVAVLMYAMDEAARLRFQSIVDSFGKLSTSNRVWHIPLAGKIESMMQWKRNAGASAVVRRNEIQLSVGLPSVLRCNIDVSKIPIGKRTLFFFPDFMLILDGRRAGSVSYQTLTIDIEKTTFIEDGAVPRDSKIVGTRWRYPNKNGGPDRRFKNNRQLPLCEYEDMLFRSSSGVVELVEFSKVGECEMFRTALGSAPQQSKSEANLRFLP